MSLLEDGDGGIQRVVPVSRLKQLGGCRQLDVLAGFLSKKQSYWRAEAKDKIIYLNYYSHTLSVGMGESEYLAQRDSSAIGSYKILNKSSTSPSTDQIIRFMKWRIKEDQIIEFSDN